MTPAEIGAALIRQSDGIISQQLARTVDEVAAIADLLTELDKEPSRPDLLWRLGTNEQVADHAHRTLELRNFITYLVTPTRDERRG
jgi:GMP synthase (glutamine-hydrolysing)